MEVLEMIKIATDFSETPGARYVSDGPYSGEEFYEKLLKNKFEKALNAGGKLQIDFDDSYGYASSFLSEAFGRLAKHFGKKNVESHLSLISSDQPMILKEVHKIILAA